MASKRYGNERHRAVAEILAQFDAGFLDRANCYFGGGTRIALALDEYRESADIDFLCSSREGYRLLRESVTEDSLGKVLGSAARVSLARPIKSDQYGADLSYT